MLGITQQHTSSTVEEGFRVPVRFKRNYNVENVSSFSLSHLVSLSLSIGFSGSYMEQMNENSAMWMSLVVGGSVSPTIGYH